MPGCRSIGGAFFLNDFDPHGRGGWAERAADLGWDTLALFGCHPTRPLDHLNGAGLLWRISGGKITAMQSDWATIEIDGVQHIVHRRPAPAAAEATGSVSALLQQKRKRRVAQKIRGNHSLRKQNPHQRASYWLD